jgi:hypothetical protein
MGESREVLNEIVFDQASKRGDPGDFLRGQPHLPGPTATGRATLAIVKNRHNEISSRRPPPGRRADEF